MRSSAATTVWTRTARPVDPQGQPRSSSRSSRSCPGSRATSSSRPVSATSPRSASSRLLAGLESTKFVTTWIREEKLEHHPPQRAQDHERQHRC